MAWQLGITLFINMTSRFFFFIYIMAERKNKTKKNPIGVFRITDVESFLFFLKL